jgi:hypothetical protein
LLALGEQLVAQHCGGQPDGHAATGHNSDYDKYYGHNVILFFVGTVVEKKRRRSV